MPRATPFTGTSATAELIAELGQPHIETHNQAQLLIWPVHSDGDGIIFGRLSGQEVQGGETAMGQIHPLRRLTSDLELRPRLIVMSVNNGGRKRYEDRPDFELGEDSATWCKWVAWRGPDRIAREILPAETYYDRLRNNSIDLYLTSLGRKVDWTRDRVYLRALGLVSAEEAASIAERTSTAIQSRYPGEKRGWPSSRRFGFRRNWATKYLEVDPEQWPLVELIHYSYADAETAHRGGVRKVRDDLTAMGCELSHQRIRTILRDPIYVTGEFAITVDGQQAPQRPIPLPKPIPPEVFARNQQLLDLRKGRETHVRPGEFALNGIKIIHAQCEHLRDKRNYQPTLRGRLFRGTYEYRHSPWVPRECHGFLIGREQLEHAVIPHLQELVDSKPLREAWRKCYRKRNRGVLPQVLDESERRQLRRRIRDRELQKAQLTRSYLQRVDQAEPAHEIAYWQLVGALQDEIDQLSMRLVRAETLPSIQLHDDFEALHDRWLSTLTLDVPDSDTRRIERASLIQLLVSKIRVGHVGIPVSRRGDSISVELLLTRLV
jgi:hypothetical protein